MNYIAVRIAFGNSPSMDVLEPLEFCFRLQYLAVTVSIDDAMETLELGIIGAYERISRWCWRIRRIVSYFHVDLKDSIALRTL